MALISRSKATDGLGDQVNFETLRDHKPLNRELVTTQLALEQLEAIQQARVGFGYTIKRLFATTATFAAVLAAPFIALLSALWIGSAEIRQLDLLDSWMFALTGSALAAAIAADHAVGKLFGVRPITAAMVAVYDMHRYTARKLSERVEESYINHEKELAASRQTLRTALLKDLKTTYEGIATQIKNQTPADQKLIEQQIPAIDQAFKGIGLTKQEITSILNPLKGALQLAGRTSPQQERLTAASA